MKTASIAITADDPEMIETLRKGFESRELMDVYGVKFAATRLNINPGIPELATLHAQEIRLVDMPWSGVGLPPVGTVCKIAASSEYVRITYPEGAEVKIYAHFTHENGTELAAFSSHDCKVYGVGFHKIFCPIRTEAQLAADRRHDAIRRAAELCAFPKADHTFVILEALYDNGLLKGEDHE